MGSTVGYRGNRLKKHTSSRPLTLLRLYMQSTLMDHRSSPMSAAQNSSLERAQEICMLTPRFLVPLSWETHCDQAYRIAHRTRRCVDRGGTLRSTAAADVLFVNVDIASCCFETTQSTPARLGALARLVTAGEKSLTVRGSSHAEEVERTLEGFHDFDIWQQSVRSVSDPTPVDLRMIDLQC